MLTVASIRPTPTHIAFQAADCVAVRDCYGAALKAGGRPSGKPGFRKEDCKSFNAAVEDLDGNTVEFICRATGVCQEPDMVDTRSSVYGGPHPMQASRPLPVRARTQSVYTAEPMPRTSGLMRSRTEPVEGFSSKTLLGTMLGAAAGAAVAYVIVRSEKGGRKAEARYSTWARGRPEEYASSRSHRRSMSVAPDDRSIWEYDAVNAAPTSGQLLIPASPVDDQRIDYQRLKVSRTSSGRNQTYEAVAVGPGNFASRRSATMPVEQSNQPLLDETQSRHSRRASLADGGRNGRHDSVVSIGSRQSYRPVEAKYYPTSQVSTLKPSRRGSIYAGSAARVPAPPSYVAASRAPTLVSTRPRPDEFFDAYYLPVDTPNDSLRGDHSDDDGLDDMRTIVPDDSISCIDIPRAYSSSKSRKSERHRSGDDRASRVSARRSHYSSAR